MKRHMVAVVTAKVSKLFTFAYPSEPYGNELIFLYKTVYKHIHVCLHKCLSQGMAQWCPT